MAEYRSLWTDDIMDVVGERNKGHVGIHNPTKQMHRAGPIVPSRGNERFADSWRGSGPFAQVARSAMLDGQLGVKSNPLKFTQELFSAETPVNTPSVVTRRIKPLTKGQPGIMRGEICLLLQYDRSSTNIIELEDYSYMQANPLCILSVGQWNEQVMKRQLETWEADHEDYRKLTPRDIFNGWKVDGIMLTDDMATGSITDRIRTTTITVRNRVNCKSYWSNVRPGSRCFLVLKKHQDGRKFELRTPEKDGTLSKSLAPMVPFTLGFYTSTYGEEPPMDVYRYEAEDGTEHYDALVIEMGSVLATPMGPGNLDSYGGDQTCHAYSPDMEKQAQEEYTMLQLMLNMEYKM